jgi:hypothetical protein
MDDGGRLPPRRHNRRRPRPEDDLILLDDYLLLLALAGTVPDALLQVAPRHHVATTNLFYARLCRRITANSATGRRLTDAPIDMQTHVAAHLEHLPERVLIVPMRELAWPMAQLAASFRGLSLLGAEAVAAAVHLDATLCVRDRNDGPGIRAAAEAMGVPYVTISS